MKAALYYPWLYLKSGAERTIAAVLAHSRHDWTVYTNRYERDATFPEFQSARVVELTRVPVKRSVDQVLGAAWQIARQRLPLEEESVLVVVCEGLGDFITFRNRSIPAVCLCLTPLRAAFDSSYQDVFLARRNGRATSRIALSGLAAAFRVVDRIAWRRYSGVVAISREVERRIVQGGLRTRSEGVAIACPGVDTAALVPTWQYQPYFLLPGRIMWTKNVQLGLRAFAHVRRTRPDLARFRLVVAGFVDEKSRPYLEELKGIAAGIPGVEWAVSPSDAELFDLYRGATAILCTPLNEDWGIVPIEAMALGKPVVAVNGGGLRETVLDGETGYLAAPTPEAFAARMTELASSPALVERMGRRAHAHAQTFDTRRFVSHIDDYLDRILEKSA